MMGDSLPNNTPVEEFGGVFGPIAVYGSLYRARDSQRAAPFKFEYAVLEIFLLYVGGRDMCLNPRELV